MSTQPLVGKPINRLEGRLKVTGAAKYAAEYDAPGLLYGYAVNSPITKGSITAIDTTAAKAVAGVIDVLTHENRPKIAGLDIMHADMDAPPGSVFKPLYDENILFNGQPVALVVADNFETARYATTLVKVTYIKDRFETYINDNLNKARDAKKGMATILRSPPPKPTGDFEKAYNDSPVKVSASFEHGAEHHNPIELFATTTVYEGEEKLTIYDKTQGTVNCQVYIANVFGLHFKDVRVIAPFVGGAFGAGTRPQQQLYLSVMAALHLKRNVRVTFDRDQMFSIGHRPATIQRTRFSTDSNGQLIAMNHSAFGETSQYEDYTEPLIHWSHMLYPAPNTLLEYQVVPVDVETPTDMRAPGGCTALFAIECTMDALAYQLNMDPLALRLKNYSDIDPSNKKPFTSKALKECYLQGAEKFGWNKRTPEPGSMTRGNKLVGYGMATGIWDAYQFPARIEAIINKEGKLIINNSITDIGTGTLTAMTQVAADELGLPLTDVTFGYGDSKMPFSFIQGGSASAASVGSGIVMAAKLLKKKLLKKAKDIAGSPLEDADESAVIFKDGRICLKNNVSAGVSFKDIIAANKGRAISVTKMGLPHMVKLRKYSKAVHSAAFVEVEVDKELKTINVTRALTAVAAGKIINPKTARSQVVGSMVWAISQALCEETILDAQLGKYMNRNLGEYHIPVHADINDLDAFFVDEKDELINELGIKGVGEIGIIALPAAIANAVFHATGKRINHLPIHFDELL